VVAFWRDVNPGVTTVRRVATTASSIVWGDPNAQSEGFAPKTRQKA
jgi:hypothetical protein